MQLPTFSNRFVRAVYSKPSSETFRGERSYYPASLQLRVGAYPLDYPLWEAEGRPTKNALAFIAALGAYLEQQFDEASLRRPNRAALKAAREKFMSLYAPATFLERK